MNRFPLLYLICTLLALHSFAQSRPGRPAKVANIDVNYEEEKVGAYSLPDPLLLNNGKRVTDTQTWINQRRPEILRLFEEYQFGKVPPKPAHLSFKVRETGTAFGGKAVRKQVTVFFTEDSADFKMDLLIYLPSHRAQPSPLLLTLSFVTNAMAVDDTAVIPGYAWVNGQRVLPTESRFGKVNVEKFIDAGIGYATVYYGDIEPDFKDGIKYGIRSRYLTPGSSGVAANEWGAISAWSWGLSRAMDYFETDKDIDATRIAINSASRLGKTVLWTGARDQRFALIIPSISGEGGAALSRRNYGETIRMITDSNRYFYQFAPNYHSFSDRVNELPMDSHMLIALVAPRPILIQSGDEDFFSDPKGEFLAAVHAEPVFKLFGQKGLGRTSFPEAGDKSMQNTLGFYMHRGGHSVLPEDFDIFIQFMKKHLKIDHQN